MEGTQSGTAADRLCMGQASKQSQQRSLNFNGSISTLSYCDLIYNTIARDSCTSAFTDKLAAAPLEGIEEFCPQFNSFKADKQKLALFLMNFVAAIVTQESSWNEKESGDGGKSKGLLQLTRASDQSKGCSCQKLNDEFNPAENLACGTHMIIKYMAEDHVVGKGSGDSGARGIARSFGPFRDGRPERKKIAAKMVSWCQNSLNSAAPPSGAAGNINGTR